MILKYESTVGKADVKGKSSRVIIPREIVKILGLEWGDKLIWNADIGDKGVTITVTTTKKEDEE
jgi:SpoVT / AbrB like domain.